MTEQTQNTDGQSTRPMFFNKLMTFDREIHANLKLDTNSGFEFAARAHLVPITISEFRYVARQYPIIFSSGAIPMPFAVLGLREGTNLMVGADNQWRNRTYIPGAIHTYPFILLPISKDSDEISLVVDPGAKCLGDTGEALFADGKPTPVLNRIIELTQTFRAGMIRTIAFGKMLAEHKMVEARGVELTLQDGSKFRVDNFLTLSPGKIDEAANNIFLRWRKEGWILPMFQYLQSMDSWSMLGDLESERRAAEAAAKA
ncbi:MAG TPA: SapC family protein [Aliidongia sp.]|uniref:SapC family protein n=1 Tax=Aliidongia sp. TaxID=1914230 RepID=UPI002DDCA523|nr:SapC family protein [Aliidongia sp.]HEV2677612.1 SapC family protein [Aliidongia sp.]